MRGNRRIVLLVAGGLALFVAIMLVALACQVARHPSQQPRPAATEVEREDCDKEDQAKGQWWEGCTIAPKPAVTKAKPSPTPTRKRRS